MIFKYKSFGGRGLVQEYFCHIQIFRPTLFQFTNFYIIWCSHVDKCIINIHFFYGVCVPALFTFKVTSPPPKMDLTRNLFLVSHMADFTLLQPLQGTLVSCQDIFIMEVGLRPITLHGFNVKYLSLPFKNLFLLACFSIIIFFLLVYIFKLIFNQKCLHFLLTLLFCMIVFISPMRSATWLTVSVKMNYCVNM